MKKLNEKTRNISPTSCGIFVTAVLFITYLVVNIITKDIITLGLLVTDFSVALIFGVFTFFLIRLIDTHREEGESKKIKPTHGDVIIPKIVTNKNIIITKAMCYIVEDARECPIANEIFWELSSILDKDSQDKGDQQENFKHKQNYYEQERKKKDG